MNEERILVCAGVAHRIPLRRVLTSNQAHAVIDLHDRDLRGHDLRSLDLDGADLRGADLRSVRTGLSVSWRLRLAAGSILASAGMGALAGFAGHRLHALITSQQRLERWIGIAMTGELLLFSLVALWKGPKLAVRRVLAPASVGAVLLGVMGALAGGTGSAGRAILAFSLLMFVVIGMGALARAVAHTTGVGLLLLVALVGASVSHSLHGGATSLLLALATLVLGRRTYRGDPELPYLTRWSRRIASAAGTSLRNADLRGAKLQGCQLVCTDLRGAKLDGAALMGASEVMCALDPAQRTLLLPVDPALARKGDHLSA